MNWQDHIIFHFLAGSHLYGTANENSDEDHRGVIIPPIKYFYGLEYFEQWEGDVYHNCPNGDKVRKYPSVACSMCRADEGEDFKFPSDDYCFYDIHKFVRLALKGNPNIIEYFWADTNVISVHPAWIELCSYKRQFLSKELAKPHMGMAQAHIKKLDVPGRKCGVKGRELIAKFGYNTKDAACVLRILWQCYELLLNCHLQFPRHDNDILKNVIAGKYTLQECKDMIDNDIEMVKDAERMTDLPEEPNYDLINKTLISILREYHG